MDVKNVYLNANLDKVIFMAQPPDSHKPAMKKWSAACPKRSMDSSKWADAGTTACVVPSKILGMQNAKPSHACSTNTQMVVSLLLSSL